MQLAGLDKLSEKHMGKMKDEKQKENLKNAITKTKELISESHEVKLNNREKLDQKQRQVKELEMEPIKLETENKLLSKCCQYGQCNSKCKNVKKKIETYAELKCSVSKKSIQTDSNVKQAWKYAVKQISTESFLPHLVAEQFLGLIAQFDLMLDLKSDEKVKDEPFQHELWELWKLFVDTIDAIIDEMSTMMIL